MNYKSLFANIKYRGLVKAVKLDWHVLESLEHYVICSTLHKKGYYSYAIVSKKAVTFMVKKLGGSQNVSVGEAFAMCKGSKHFADNASVRNALYALAGTKQGTICKIVGIKLFFNIWKHSRKSAQRRKIQMSAAERAARVALAKKRWAEAKSQEKTTH